MPVSQIQNASLASGVPGKANLPTGSVLQVVSATSTSTTTISSASTWTTTNFSVSITPTNSSSRILVMLLGGFIDTMATARQAALTFYRGASTNLGDSTRGIVQYYGASSRIQSGVSFGIYDSPATTSSTTYTLYVRSNNGNGDTLTWNIDPAVATLIAMEIAA